MSSSNNRTSVAPAHAPLSGVTVIEIGQNIAAPTATQVLGDLGAQVIKVEKLDGDDARAWGPPFWDGAASMFQAVNRNKASVAVNFRDPADLAAVERLILEEADVVLQSMRPGLLAAQGLGAQRLRELKPSLVWCDLGAFGSGGPLSDKPGYDPLMQAFAGLMSVTGEEGRPPVRTGYSVVDMGTGMWAANAILAALFRRQATGEGCCVEVSLYETALAWMSIAAAHFMSSGEVPGRHGSGAATIVPYRAYATSDGHLVVASGNNSLFEKFCTVLGHPEWTRDERFATNPARVAHRAQIDGLIEPLMARRSTQEWVGILERAGIPCAPVQSIDQTLQHPQTQALGILQPVPGSPMTLVGMPARFDGTRPPIRSGSSALNADAELLQRYRDQQEMAS
ncbi:CoA transferase [uncultured Azohydromonas sp.]|mgnify:CR=1 FL=1|jgi:Predicted acyl-CoA transferases/carnitine dehydratase|uniref:CaiB/BaiF CoA transferase family protein n=1 Tax=uncultured Azohydromonas sp. TaxID=487342 RepID=UPI002611CB43|nr:CoA transferase [uncultured Azohydromonas sp.]